MKSRQLGSIALVDALQGSHTGRLPRRASTPTAGLTLPPIGGGPVYLRPVPRRDRPDDGILSPPLDGDWQIKLVYPDVEAKPGLVVMHRASGTRGTIVAIDRDGVTLRTATGADRLFRLVPGAFAVNGESVTLVRPTVAGGTTAKQTASGSVGSPQARARVAAASRIWVEGVHDAELVEKVWGDDLRRCGVVVERLDGIDDLAAEIDRFRPAADRRLGVLVDHLVDGSKEARIAASIRSAHVLVTGTPYVDVWQAIRPKVLGIEAWPVIPMGQSWKAGICAAFGVDEPGRLWRMLLAKVDTYADLEPALVGAVEQLIDFVTA